MKKNIIYFVLCLSILLSCFSAQVVADETIPVTSSDIFDTINAKAYVLMDAHTGTVLLKHNENEKLYPASVTKIMTLILICEAIEQGKLTLDMEITCSESASKKGGSQIWLEPGEIMRVDDLLKAIVVYSANDACCLLGEYISGSEDAFCVQMNKKAKELGMKNTNFDNCTGLDDDTTTHLTTAHDVGIMSRELLKYDLIREYTSIWMDTLRNGETQIVNTNKLIRTYYGATGLKTGTTNKAGCCISATAKRDNLELIAVVLGANNSKDRFNAAKSLLDYGFANYELFYANPTGLYENKIKVTKGISEFVEITSDRYPELLIKKGEANNIKYDINLPQTVEAPIEKNQILGSVFIKLNNKTLGEIKIKASDKVEQMTIFNSIKMLFYSLKK